ncbi:MAG: xanthine dehydrogenase family protein molybdopterin-binding subunit, partial [Tumebacillaceae bacterium]
VLGVEAVLTGAVHPFPTGPLLADRPPIAVDKVRYYGEVVALVVADTERNAKRAAERVRIQYEPLPVVNSPSSALRPDAPRVHDNPAKYKHIEQVEPVPYSNIASIYRIRKGDMASGWAASEVVVEGTFAFNNSDHAAMEPRCAIAEAMQDRVIIHATTQDPYVIKKLFKEFFHIDEGKVIVRVPFVGGGFGGKSSIQLEYLAYLASRECGGRPVKVRNTREHDMITSACHIGLEAKVKLGCTADGKLMAAEITHLFDTGAYTDMGANVTRAGANDCTGPYRIDNVHCDSLCMYTNHPYASSFRGFGHPELHFCVERTMDLLAKKLNMDPLELRLRNSVGPGDTTPTQAPLNESNIGDLKACIRRLRELIRWDEGQRIDLGDKVRTKGIACLWKTSSSPPNASAGAVITFNAEGTVNLTIGAVELGQGNRTAMAQILAERMKMDVDDVYVKYEVDTQSNPEHWKTVASTATMMVGRAVIAAADDAIGQLIATASQVLKRAPEELEVGHGKVFVRNQPQIAVKVSEVALGYEDKQTGTAIGRQVIGRGQYMVKGQTKRDPATGKGVVGPQWTVGAQAVEVEFDKRENTYKLLRAASVFDAGKVINLATATGQIMGGMSMGLSWASREHFVYDEQGRVLNNQFRHYKLTHFGENPEFLVDFVETPYQEGPYGARGIGEYGVICMAPALANALSVAAEVELNQLPLTPERIWRQRGGAQR